MPDETAIIWDEPIALGLDTSGPFCRVALVSANHQIHRQESMHKGQAERLMPMAEELLHDQDLTWQDVATIGVCVGPGNFTGIRIGVAAARGLAVGLGVPAVGVDSFEALRYGHSDVATVASVDARNDQIYAQLHLPGSRPQVAVIADPNDPPAEFRNCRPVCIGHSAAELAQITGGDVGKPITAAAVAIAQIALSHLGQNLSRPIPVYIRPADAAPMRIAAPPILP